MEMLQRASGHWAGPAGLFAALRLIELGLKPIVVERGRRVAVVVT
jgi:2-polyprenyl-6-methoxyphenol hydroxylase-like FAD-dependent oxidoreductase